MGLYKWQASYVCAGTAMLPFVPLLYLQGQLTRRKVGVLPDAAGGQNGSIGEGDDAVRLLVIGESTVAGLGARTHDLALAGRFSYELSKHIERPVKWTVIGKNGVTARRTINELLPKVPDETYDYILLGIGGNDVMKLSSPVKWRRDMIELLGILRAKYPNAPIFITNCPMIKMSTAIPQPIKFILWELSKAHDSNIKEFTADMDRVFYYHQPRDLEIEGFFADGIHPSEKGYADWSEAMMKFFTANYKW